MVLTEADLLDLVRKRYTPRPKPGYPPRYTVLTHVQPPSSYAARKHTRIADAIVLDRNSTFPPRPIADGPDQWGRVAHSDYERGYNAVHGFEVKVSRSDWLRELADPSKAEAWKQFCQHWWLVAPRDVVKPGELPEGWGHLAPSGAILRAVEPAPLLQPRDMPSAVVVALLRAAGR